MYKSKKQIESKLAQAKYVLKVMQNYRGKIFVNNGIDPETGAIPLQVNISSFLAHTRSVLQYAYKESTERGTTSIYEAAVNNRPVIGLFRDLRNTDIHEMVIGTHTVINVIAWFNKAENPGNERSETKSEEANIVNHLSKPMDVTKEFIEKLRKDGRTDLADAADSGESIYEIVEFEGENDLYVLCEKYIDSLVDFVSELVKADVVT